ncbi:MAG: transposase [Bacteroidales bacterium]|nr:transposase [Bacteroidales bacterium]
MELSNYHCSLINFSGNSSEFYLDQNFPSLELARKVSHNAIRIYNTKRLHLSLNYKTPEEVFKMRA